MRAGPGQQAGGVNGHLGILNEKPNFHSAGPFGRALDGMEYESK